MVINEDLLKIKHENKLLKRKYQALILDYKTHTKKVENTINKEIKKVKNELEKKHTEQIKKYEDVIKDKNAQIESLKRELAKKQSILDNNSYNSGIPTSKTKIGEKKYIPNTREKTNKNIGGQKGHKKHKLQRFNENDATEIVEIINKECPKCKCKEIEVLETSTDKCEIDYDVKLIKRINRFKECKCKNCGCVYRAQIPNDLKEECQYGKTVQSLALCLTNEIYTPFNKTVKLISGITNEEINLSEGYVAKLQKKAYNLLEDFDMELTKYFPKQYVYCWDDGVISVNAQDACFRTYCTDNVTLFKAHEKKNKEGIDKDNILASTTSETTVMHDHLKLNYNKEYDYKNVECVIHLIRRCRKMKEITKHTWEEKLCTFLSKTIHKRNRFYDDNKKCIDYFNKEEIDDIKKEFDKIIDFGMEEYKKTELKTLNEEELTLLEDIKKYKDNYLLWLDDKMLPTTNNNSERAIRPIKSKMKISGQFKNIKYAQYYARIRSYIETCKRNNINIVEACIRLLNGNPYTLDDILTKNKPVK